MALKTYRFNTGVKYSDSPVLIDGMIVSSNGVKVIPFECEEVPEGYKFHSSCDNPDLLEKAKALFSKDADYVIREVVNNSFAMRSKYAYFEKKK